MKIDDQTRTEILEKFKEAIDFNKTSEDDEVIVVQDDKSVEELANKQGYCLLGDFKGFYVKLIRTARKVIFILLMAMIIYEGIHFLAPREEDKQQIFSEYLQVGTWETRTAERGDFKAVISFEVQPPPPHTPEEDLQPFPQRLTLSAPISGLSNNLFNYYSGIAGVA